MKPGPPGAGHPCQLMRHRDSGLVLGVPRSNDMFDPSRTGLDHVALTVADRAALHRWSQRLDEFGAAHSPIRDAGYAEFVSVFDPDGIQWELWAAT